MLKLNETIGRTIRTLAASGSVLVVAAGPAVARGTGEYGSGMMGGGWGAFGGWMFFWPLLLLGLVALVVYWAGSQGRVDGGKPPDRPLAELRERYARGEISDEEFEQRRRRLQDE